MRRGSEGREERDIGCRRKMGESEGKMKREQRWLGGKVGSRE